MDKKVQLVKSLKSIRLRNNKTIVVMVVNPARHIPSVLSFCTIGLGILVAKWFLPSPKAGSKVG